MAVELFIPKLGQTVEEVTLLGWLVQDGDTVEQGQPVLEVETDKAVFPVEANASGVIHLGPYKKGDVLPVVTTVAVIGKPEDRFPGTEAVARAESAKVEAAPSTPVPTQAAPSAPEDGGKLFASPRARRLAQEAQVPDQYGEKGPVKQ